MDPLDPVEISRRKTGRPWLDLIVAGSAIVIAVISLIVALRQSQIMERQLAASNWPFIQYGTSNGSDDRKSPIISLELKNAGVGPARMHRLQLRFDGKPVTSGKALIEACCSDLQSGGRPRWSNSTASDRVITPGETVTFFLLTDAPENAPYWARLNEIAGKIELHACYCSVLDECWALDSARSEPASVNACPGPQPDDYLN